MASGERGKARGRESRPWFVAGTGTGVGKTVLTSLLARRLRETGWTVAALKPLCSGGRGDARSLRLAAGPVLELDEVNPWHFREPLAPLIAARRSGLSLRASQVVTFVRRVQARSFEVVLVEGAGGLLSPLVEDGDARTLIEALAARPVLVCANRLGVLNEVLLSLEVLPAAHRGTTPVVVMQPRRRTLASRTNLPWLRERLGGDRVHELPWMEGWEAWLREGLPARLRKALDPILAGLGCGPK